MTINAAVARIVVTDLSFAVPCSVRFSDRERQLMVVAINGIGSSFIVVGALTREAVNTCSREINIASKSYLHT